MAVDVSSWPKDDQYVWALKLLYGKMVSDQDCRYFSGRCPDLRQEAGVICPRFTAADIPRMTEIYMRQYPEHRGYEARLAWLVMCIFGGFPLPATPPGVTQRAPFDAAVFARPIRPVIRGSQVSPAPARSPRPYVAPPAEPPAEDPGEGFPTWAKVAGAAALAYFLLRR